MSDVTPLDFSNALRTAFNTFWAARTPIAWPNKDFDPAREVGDDADAAWVRFASVGDTDGNQRYSGSVDRAHFSRSGIATIEVYVRQQQTTDLAYTLANAALQFFEKPGVANALFGNISSPVEIGNDGTWFQLTVSANWTYFTDRAS